MTDNPHEDLEVHCGSVLTDDDGEPLTKEVEYENPKTGETRTEEQPQRCNTTLTYEEHYIGIGAPHDPDVSMEQALKFRCPECGDTRHACPVCSDSNTPGWFRGETTGELIPCHNCNQEEVARQRREGVPY